MCERSSSSFFFQKQLRTTFQTEETVYTLQRDFYLSSESQVTVFQICLCVGTE